MKRCALVFFFCLFRMIGQQPAACSITITARPVKDATGVVGFVMFSTPAGWPSDLTKAYKHDAVPARPGTVQWKADRIAPGQYAIVALHDENQNQKLDRKPSGRPREGWGMSRDPKVGMKTPGFKSAVTSVRCGDRVEITMRYPAKETAK